MGKFVAILTGESDRHIVSREFTDQTDAISWLCGAGLADFDDQLATGEIQSGDGQVIWRKSKLQTEEAPKESVKLGGSTSLPATISPFHKRSVEMPRGSQGRKAPR
jgi:hypothetical protein